MMPKNNFCLKASLLAISVFSLLHSAECAITAEQAKTSIEAYNNVYWHQSNKTFYKYDNKTGTLDYWMWAHAWETEMDAYERTKDPIYLQKIKDTYDGFTAMNGTLMRNAYNDDQGWWVMAAARAYDLTGVVDYRTFAKNNFDWMYSHEVDNVFGGGIWWKNTDRNQKNSASTLPFSLVGFKLARQLSDPSYGEKAKSLHAWVRLKLFRTYGEVADRIQHNGAKDTVFWGPLSYNHGTFVSSSWEMFKLTKDSTYFKDAIQTLEYFKNILSNKTTGILPDERGDGTGNTDNDAGMYKTVFVHYAMRFIMEAKQWQYMPWMNANAESLWKNRRQSDNLMYFAWATPTPTQSGKLGAQMASGGVALLNLMVIAQDMQLKNTTGVDAASVQGQGLANIFRVSAMGISAKDFTYSLSQQGVLSLSVYDYSGHFLQTLFTGSQNPGTHSLVIPKALASQGRLLLKVSFNGKETIMTLVH
jgi:predicted alpha-1,6-mannanase (GH76 family)